MTEQHKYYTLTEDVKTLIQYIQEQAIDHSVVEAANRLNWAIKKGLREYDIPVTSIKESKDSFEKEKQQYAEDSRTNKKPWELWQWQIRGCTTWSSLLGDDPMWLQNRKYRRKPSAFVPKSYSGLNWRVAEHLIGKTVECSNNPDICWHVGILKTVKENGGITHFAVNVNGCISVDFFIYIRTCEETFKHPTINIGGVELPIPETFALEFRTKYWLSPTCTEMCWNCAPSDIDALQAGQVHLTEERAKAWADWWNKEVLAKIKEIAS